MTHDCTKCGQAFERTYTRSRCNSCRAEYNRELYHRNLEKSREQAKIRNTRRKDALASYREENREAAREYSKVWYQKNKDKRLAQTKKYRQENTLQYRSYVAKYKAARLRATPQWADLEAIKEFYKNCPEGYEVDHVHPLQGKNICGLHILSNLQYLTVSENRKKHNRLKS